MAAIETMRAAELASEIREAQEWSEVKEQLVELCEIAGMADEWEAADGETFESVVYAAAEKLGVELF